MVTTQLDSNAMAVIAIAVLEMPSYSEKRQDEAFRSFFGVPLNVIVSVWNRIQPSVDEPGAHPKHLLWALVFLKTYATTAVHCRIVGWPDPKTYRKWSWYFLEKIAALKHDIIQLDNRFKDYDGSSHCLISVDGIDCMVNEPWPFSTDMYSQKFNGPAVKYEVGVSIVTGHIVWINGPFKASVNDSTICKNKLLTLLATDEGVEVDGGYKGSDKFKTPTVASSRQARKQKSVVRGRHENVNSRLKIFNVLNIPFRHLNPRNKMMEKHGLCFDSVAVLTQLKFEEAGETLYSVNYDVTYD